MEKKDAMKAVKEKSKSKDKGKKKKKKRWVLFFLFKLLTGINGIMWWVPGQCGDVWLMQ